MEKFDQRIDTYIENSADFAKPILKHIRHLIHKASPHITETIKWSFPHFDYKGTICSMASFKSHCSFGFWKSSILSDPHHILKNSVSEAMGQMGRICSLQDLPDDEILTSYITEAISLNEKGIKIPAKKTLAINTKIETPVYFKDFLKDHPEAQSKFEQFSNSHRKEYIIWFEEAKSEGTRNKRIMQALEWLKEGKGRNWKYERK